MADQQQPVGYKAPPEKNRFKAGRSGNPSGRPKQRPTMATALRNELEQLVDSGGQQISKAEAVAKALVAAAAAGNLRAANVLLAFVDKAAEPDADAGSTSDADAALVDDYIERELRRRMQNSASEEAKP